MARLELTIDVQAPPERCFDLSRDLDLHLRSMGHTNETIVGGRTSGLIELGEEVTWRGKHFGVYHRHTSRITAYDRPRHFRDEMVSGRFEAFRHDHHFEPIAGGTRIRDVLEFRSPLGPIGALVDALLLKPYLRRLLVKRSEVVREEAERR